LVWALRQSSSSTGRVPPVIARPRLSSPGLAMRATQKLSSLCRTCRHRCPANAVIAGLAPIRATQILSSPGLTRRSIARWGNPRAAKPVCSPPPCGEGLGVGVTVGGRVPSYNNHPLPSPPPQGGREHTEYAAHAVVDPEPVTAAISPRHPCEMTGNLGFQPGTHQPRSGLSLIDDTQKPSL
jgi:hypothetical protein